MNDVSKQPQLPGNPLSKPFPLAYIAIYPKMILFGLSDILFDICLYGRGREKRAGAR